jgi:predicted nucleic acid-binding protein
MNGKMRIIDFNDDFQGFEDNEDVLLDTGVILALLNQYDVWHSTVKSLFDKYVFTESSNLYLYIHPGIVNEVTFLSDKPLKQFMLKHGLRYSREEIEDTTNATIKGIRELIEKEYLLILDGNTSSILKQIDFSHYFGSMDALTVSLTEEYGISLLTLDKRLIDNINNKKDTLKNIQNLYYSTSEHRDY